MPRPRKNDPSSLLNPILSQFAARIAQAVERFTITRVENAVLKEVRSFKGRKGSGPRGVVNCYFPGCRNVAAPRFGMFCAAEHKRLPKSEKDKYRAQHLAARQKAEGPRNGARARRPHG
jgi:hypothetical protein